MAWAQTHVCSYGRCTWLGAASAGTLLSVWPSAAALAAPYMVATASMSPSSWSHQAWTSCLQARKQAQAYFRLYHEHIPVAQLVREVAAVMQEYTREADVEESAAVVPSTSHQPPHCWPAGEAANRCLMYRDATAHCLQSLAVCGHSACRCCSLGETRTARSCTKSIPRDRTSPGRRQQSARTTPTPKPSWRSGGSGKAVCDAVCMT